MSQILIQQVSFFFYRRMLRLDASLTTVLDGMWNTNSSSNWSFSKNGESTHTTMKVQIGNDKLETFRPTFPMMWLLLLIQSCICMYIQLANCTRKWSAQMAMVTLMFQQCEFGYRTRHFMNFEMKEKSMEINKKKEEQTIMTDCRKCGY